MSLVPLDFHHFMSLLLELKVSQCDRFNQPEPDATFLVSFLIYEKKYALSRNVGY